MRCLQIFVSSTFSDMHRERDLLHQVAGLINRDIVHTGYQIVLRDLRYGINTADLQSERDVERTILSECFDVIDDCALFVLLLGNRYGTVFHDTDTPQRYLPHVDLEGKSVTHLEVEYGRVRIDKQRLLVFERALEGAVTGLSLPYRETEEGAAKVRLLRDTLLREGYTIDRYTATAEGGALCIDEHYFIKHTQGLLEQRVLEYIAAQPATAAAATEALHPALQQALEQKLAVYPAPYRACAEALLRLRMQDLLHQADYDAVRRFGRGGKALLDYRCALVASQPDDILELLQAVCACLAEVTAPTSDVFRALQLLACAQTTALAQTGGISLHELTCLLENTPLPHGQDYDAWQAWRSEAGGMQHAQTPLQRAFSCLLDTLLTHTEAGYAFVDEAVASLLAATAPAAVRERLQHYAAAVFWYLPKPAKAWLSLLREGRYALCVACVEQLHYDERFTNALCTYLEDEHVPVGELLSLLEELLKNAIKLPAAPTTLYYLLTVAAALVEFASYDDDIDGDELFANRMVPLYQTVHQRFYETHKDALTLEKRYFLYQVYNRFELELDATPPPLLTPPQQDEAEALYGAILQFLYPTLPPELEGDSLLETLGALLQQNAPPTFAFPEEFEEALNLLHSYLPQKAALTAVFQLYMLNCGSQPLAMLESLAVAVLKGAFSTAFAQTLAENCLYIHPTAYDLETTIAATVLFLAIPALAKKELAHCLAALHTVYALVRTETKLLRCDWFRWSTLVSCDLIDKLRDTDDAVVAEIALVQDDFFGADYDELAAIDANLVKAARQHHPQ